MNYQHFYRMQADPFPLIPTLEIFFESTTHLKAIDFVLSVIDSSDSFALILGDYGTGKTSLCLKLVNVFRSEAQALKDVIYIPTPLVSYNKVLRTVVKSLTKTKKNLLQYSNETLQQIIYEYYERYTNDKSRIVFLLDDFQEYSSTYINQIKWMGSFLAPAGFYPFLFVLLGHSILAEKIQAYEFGSFYQKIRQKYILTPFDQIETKEYIYFRLFNAGAKGFPYFPDEIILEIYKMSKGIPRQINLICNECLKVGAKLERRIIDWEVFQETVAVMGKLDTNDHRGRSLEQGPKGSTIMSATQDQPQKPTTPQGGPSSTLAETKERELSQPNINRLDIPFSVADELSELSLQDKKGKNKFLNKFWLGVIIVAVIVLLGGMFLFSGGMREGFWSGKQESGIKQSIQPFQQNFGQPNGQGK